MALTLTAEQKSIYEIFSGKNQYIIPPYQRAYSWTEQECMELFEDLIKAYSEKKDEGYFLGNIVIAKSIEDRNSLEVIDGQQRLTTLTLLIKVLLVFDDESDDLKNAIMIPGGRRSEEKKQRLKTNIFMAKDSKELREALELNLENTFCKKNDNRFKKNICYFYNEIKELFTKRDDIQDFIDFFMYDVSLLPIQTEDSNPDKAREKALKIFETINNRGMSLSDSDIFKAKLFSMALNKLKHENFISRWKELDEECSTINYSIDGIFKIYTHIIRGKEGIKSSEINLREFFVQAKYSPFKKLDYDLVLDDLSKIIDSIKFFQDVVAKPSEYKELTKWFQLINQYTNKYPLNTILVYLYCNGIENSPKLVNFSKNLVRYAYYQGSTTRIKTFIYDLIVKTISNEKFEFYPKEFHVSDVRYFGRLKNGFALLAQYLDEEKKAIYPYYFDKIITSKNRSELDSSWEEKDYYDYVDTIGNLLVSKVGEKKGSVKEWSYLNYESREKKLEERLIKFFTEKVSNED